MNAITELSGKSRYSVEDLLKIMEVLRSDQGCSWDREQTHKSIRQDFLEECYEVIEAIDLGNDTMLREELGDVLLNIVLHSHIAKEEASFDFADVVSDVAAKMVQRHPHVFGTVKVNGTEEVLTNWDKIKAESKGQKTTKEALQSVSPALPALVRCQKLIKKAAKAKLQTPTPFGDGGNADADLIGKLLISVVSLAQQSGVDAEEALAKAAVRMVDSM